MKKTITIITIMFFATMGHAQDKFTTYDNSYDGKTYKIGLSSKDKDTTQYQLWIDALPLDALHKTGGIEVTNETYDDFISTLNAAKLKYQEWADTAKRNNITEVTKSMDLSCKVAGYFIYGKDWQFQFSLKLKFRFKIIDKTASGEGIQYLLIVNTGELTSSDNEFMKVDGFALAFTSSKEIDSFIEKISYKNICKFIKAPKPADILK